MLKVEILETRDYTVTAYGVRTYDGGDYEIYYNHDPFERTQVPYHFILYGKVYWNATLDEAVDHLNKELKAHADHMNEAWADYFRSAAQESN